MAAWLLGVLCDLTATAVRRVRATFFYIHSLESGGSAGLHRATLDVPSTTESDDQDAACTVPWKSGTAAARLREQERERIARGWQLTTSESIRSTRHIFPAKLPRHRTNLRCCSAPRGRVLDLRTSGLYAAGVAPWCRG